MTVLAGCGVRESGAASLSLAAMLARSSGEDVIVAVVVAAAWPPSPERPDADYRALVARRAQETIDQARRWMPEDVAAEFVVHDAASIPVGLLELGAAHGASVLVLGSAESGGLGHVALGSVADRLLHGSGLPVAFAPRGFRASTGARVGRVTAAYGGTQRDREVIIAAAQYAASISSALRIASFAVRPRMVFASTMAGSGEEAVLDHWFERTASVLRERLHEVQDLPDVPRPLEILVGDGHGWSEAIGKGDWASDDVLVVGAGSQSPLASLVLGSRASKILRNTPAPVIALPRGGRLTPG
jgi:nucleotide-binding universal stress UspA family protein